MTPEQLDEMMNGVVKLLTEQGDKAGLALVQGAAWSVHPTPNGEWDLALSINTNVFSIHWKRWRRTRAGAFYEIVVSAAKARGFDVIGVSLVPVDPEGRPLLSDLLGE